MSSPITWDVSCCLLCPFRRAKDQVLYPTRSLHGDLCAAPLAFRAMQDLCVWFGRAEVRIVFVCFSILLNLTAFVGVFYLFLLNFTCFRIVRFFNFVDYVILFLFVFVTCDRNRVTASSRGLAGEAPILQGALVKPCYQNRVRPSYRVRFCFIWFCALYRIGFLLLCLFFLVLLLSTALT